MREINPIQMFILAIMAPAGIALVAALVGFRPNFSSMAYQSLFLIPIPIYFAHLWTHKAQRLRTDALYLAIFGYLVGLTSLLVFAHSAPWAP